MYLVEVVCLAVCSLHHTATMKVNVEEHTLRGIVAWSPILDHAKIPPEE